MGKNAKYYQIVALSDMSSKPLKSDLQHLIFAYTYSRFYASPHLDLCLPSPVLFPMLYALCPLPASQHLSQSVCVGKSVNQYTHAHGSTDSLTH